MELADLRQFAGELIERFPMANSGGCCVIAATVAPYLAEHFGDVRIRVQSYSRADVSKLASQWREPNGHAGDWSPIQFHHVYVDFKYRGRWYHFEAGSCGRGAPSGYVDTVPGALPLVHAQALADNPRNWNSMFDRDEIPELERMVHEFFECHRRKEAA